jgi:hypothetical protein
MEGHNLGNMDALKYPEIFLHTALPIYHPYYHLAFVADPAVIKDFKKKLIERQHSS